MSKIICEICGTVYQSTAECCPICGSHQETDMDFQEDLLEEEGSRGKSGLFTAKKKEIFDFDEVNSEPAEMEDEFDQDEEDSNYDEEEETEEEPRHNTFLVILLTILIAGLLIAAGFVFVRYFLPNMNKDEAVVPETTQAAVQDSTEETELKIPCETLIVTSGKTAELNEIGQHFLLHVIPMPENTTDKIIYTVADESIASVTEDGKITAVAEGETVVYISCGEHNHECNVIVKLVEETEPPTEETVPEESDDLEDDGTDETAAATEPAEVAASDVVLKLKKTDIKLGVYYQFTLELDCDLEQNEVTWTSEHPHIATVDENGVVTAVKSGTTSITATYGSQSVSCMVRCG